MPSPPISAGDFVSKIWNRLQETSEFSGLSSSMLAKAKSKAEDLWEWLGLNKTNSHYSSMPSGLISTSNYSNCSNYSSFGFTPGYNSTSCNCTIGDFIFKLGINYDINRDAFFKVHSIDPTSFDANCSYGNLSAEYKRTFSQGTEVLLQYVFNGMNFSGFANWSNDFSEYIFGLSFSASF